MNVNIKESGGGSHTAPKSKYNEVVKFFPVSVDNFFDNPDKIVKYAKNLPKEPDPIGKWPGNRTESIWKINKELNDLIILKILSCYYDLSYQDISWDYADLYFHEIPTIFKDKNDVRNKGEIHVDANDAPYEIAGLIYLTPDIDSDLGTSLFTLKQRNDKGYLKFSMGSKFGQNLLKPNQNISDDKEEFDEAYFTKRYKKHEEFFIEKTRFANIYNRMITYDTNEFHRANNFYNGDGKDHRLTLVFFIGGLGTGRADGRKDEVSYPLEKVKGGELEEFIEYQCTPKE